MRGVGARESGERKAGQGGGRWLVGILGAGTGWKQRGVAAFYGAIIGFKTQA